MRRHPRLLGDDGGVEVHHLEIERSQFLGDVAQQAAAVGPFEFRIGIGIVLADVAEAGGAQQRIADGVQQHIGVGMAIEPFLVLDLDAADHQLAAVDQWVHVEALADSHAPRARIASAIATSSG